MNNQRRVVWTVDGAEKAAGGGYYILVPTGSRRYLSGAARSWSNPNESDIIFNTDFRIAGKPDDIRQALAAAGYDHGTIENAIATSISRENQNEFLNTNNYERMYRLPVERRNDMTPVQNNIPADQRATYIEIYNQILEYLQRVTYYSPEAIREVITEINKLKARLDRNVNFDVYFNPENVRSINSRIQIYEQLLELLNNQRNLILREEDTPQRNVNIAANAGIIAEINGLKNATTNEPGYNPPGRSIKRAIQ